VNGLSTDIKSWKRNWKYKKLPYLWRRLNVDLISLVETQAQPALLDATCNMPSTLFAHETHVTKLSNNSNELINKHQQGGLMSSVRGECCKLVTATSCDPTGLARWQSIDLKNANGKIRFITAYQGVPSKQTSNTVHQQQLRYWQRHNRNICPRKAFALDIKEHLQKSLQEGFAIILCLDSNEDMTSGRLFKVFTQMGLIETYKTQTQLPPPNSFFKGTRQLDAIWVSPSLHPKSTSITPHFFGVGDHRTIIVDFDVESILGNGFIPFCPQKMRRLNTSNALATNNYIEKAEALFQHHRIMEKLESIEAEGENLSSEERQRKLNHIDKMATELLLSAERKCRNLRTGAVQFNPDLSKLGLTWRFWRKVVHFRQKR